MNLSKRLINDSYLRDQSRDGVITAELLERLGIPQRTTYRRCQPGGPWTHLLPGIVLLSLAPATSRQRVEATRLYTNLLGIVTGFEAARRYGLTEVPSDNTVHVLVSGDHKFTSPRFTIVERTMFLPRPNMVDGVPLAPPARAVLDGVRRVRKVEPVRALLLDCLESRLCSLAELTSELDAGSRRGTALPRAVLKELAEDVRSVPEAEALSIWKRAGLPPAQRNIRIYDERGTYIAMPDTWCDEVAMAWEIDSLAFHLRRNFAKTLARNARYAGVGVVVVQTLPSRLKKEPAAVAKELRAAYQAALLRPRPPITVVRPDRRAA